jgi:Na+-transporting NADH:ubiquinone oxidoreductase subunit C
LLFTASKGYVVQQPSQASRSGRTIAFVTVLCLLSALILALMATGLREHQLQARRLDEAKQMLRAARLYTTAGTFQLQREDGSYGPALYDVGSAALVEGAASPAATREQIQALYKARIKPYLADGEGKITPFAKSGLDLDEYIAAHQVTGYAQLEQKLFYVILPNYSEVDNPKGERLAPAGYLIPVSGFGLWGPIFGYLALGPDANSVIGVSWNAPLETPGLGAIIQDPKWQDQFEGKEVFLPSSDGTTDFSHAALGLTVVKGRVRDVLGNSPRAKTAVDGITGASLTCNGVTAAYGASLHPYRPLLLRFRRAYDEDQPLEEMTHGE